MRRRYVLDPRPGANRRWVEVDETAPEPRLHVISDGCDGFVSQADGRTYESKSEYRQSLKRHGLIEMGNDKPTPQPYRPLPDWGDVIHRAAADRGL